MPEQITHAIVAGGDIVPTLVQGEMRILDTDLARRLGFARPADIRKLIERHAETLNKISILAMVARDKSALGRPSSDYYLNKKQAIFITAKSETEKATDITIEIIEKFDAYERGVQPAPKPMTREQIMAQALMLADQTMKEQAEQIAVLLPKADALDRISSSEGSLCISDSAKALQVRPKDLFDFLRSHSWIYRRAGSDHWVGYQPRTSAGDLAHKVKTVLRADGSEKITEQVRVTPQGLAKLAKLVSSRPTVSE